MGDVKQTNFRIDQDTADAFRKFCEENGMNQAQGFDHIMQVVELDKAKAVTPGRATEIECFEKSVKELLSAYLNSIEICNNTEERIREQFASAIKRSEKTIGDQQQTIEQLQEDVKTAKEAETAAEAAQKAAEERERNAVAQMEAAKKNSTDQERINSMLTAQLADANDRLTGYDSLKASEQELLRQLADAERKFTDQQKAHENELKQAKTSAELDKERAVMSKERELYDQIRQVDRENAKLAAQIEQLRTQFQELSVIHESETDD